MNNQGETNVTDVHSKVQKIRSGINAQTQASNRKQKIYMIIGTIVIVSSFFSLLSLTTTASKLDAQALTQIARLQVEQQLPEGRESVKTYLETEAPALIQQLVDSLLGMLPDLRGLVAEGFEKKMAEVQEQVETQLRTKLNAALQSARANIDRAFPDTSEQEKMEKLVAYVARDFEKSVEICFDEIYPEYSAEMNRIRSYLADLNHKDDSQLTDRERTHKEIFQTLLRLMLREKSNVK